MDSPVSVRPLWRRNETSKSSRSAATGSDASAAVVYLSDLRLWIRAKSNAVSESSRSRSRPRPDLDNHDESFHVHVLSCGSFVVRTRLQPSAYKSALVAR